MSGGIPAAATAVTRLDSSASVESTSMSYPVSTGTDSNRLLVVGIGDEGAGPSGVTYGGQTMNLEESDNNSSSRVYIYTLNEAGLDAAVGSTISVTGGTYIMIFASSYDHVNQSTPVPETNSTNSASASFLSIPISAADGSAVYGLANQNSNSASPSSWATGDLTGLGDDLGDATPGFWVSAADGLFSTGQTVTVRCDWNNTDRGAIAAIEIAAQ